MILTFSWYYVSIMKLSFGIKNHYPKLHAVAFISLRVYLSKRNLGVASGSYSFVQYLHAFSGASSLRGRRSEHPQAGGSLGHNVSLQPVPGKLHGKSNIEIEGLVGAYPQDLSHHPAYILPGL